MILDHHEVKNRLLTSIDKAIQEGRWDSGLFYKNVLKRLLKMREYVIDQLPDENETAVDVSSQDIMLQHKEGYELVYVAIYQAEGNKLDRWLSVIRTLNERCMSRPVYPDEAQVQETMRSKRSRNHAYVVVWIKKTDIISSPNGNIFKDQLGHELVTLKDNSLKLNNIIEFVHDGRRYLFKEDRLLLRN